MIRVMVADDHTLVREGLRVLLHLTPDIRVVAETADGPETARLAAETVFDVLLLDIKMPGMSGLEVMRELHQQTGRVPPTLVLTTFDDDVLVLDAIRAGARGFLLKDATFDALIGAIRVVAAGGTLLRPGVTERVLSGVPIERPFEAATDPDGLTAREREVVRLLAGGYSNKEIAYALHVAEGTAKNHVSHILSKLGVRDRTRAVLRALELGWL